MCPLTTGSPILVCRQPGAMAVAETGEVTVTTSLLACLSEATRRAFGLIIVDAAARRRFQRDDIVALCRCLTTHPLTRETPLLVSVDRPHRRLTELLDDAGVRFMQWRQPGAAIDPESLLRLVKLKDPSLDLCRILGRLCPFIQYRPIDDHCELITCRAYRNRMVLGGKRLHEVCERGSHVRCEYFLNGKTHS